MKYFKPEIEIKDIILPPIASNPDEWDGTENAVTDSFLNFSW